MGEFTNLEFEGAVARLRLNRPDKRNALTRQTLEEIVGAVREVDASVPTRVLVLEAVGAAFCAGMDLGEMQSRAGSENRIAEWQRDSEVYRDAVAGVFKLPLPTIALVNGPAVAGGVGLVAACDFVLMAENAFLALPEPARGITAAMVTPLLTHRVGPGRAQQLLLSGSRWTAQQAHAAGFAYDLAPPNELARRLDQLIASILVGSKSALAISKSHLIRASQIDIDRVLAESMRVSAEARATADAKEGLAAFIEKRQPRWVPFAKTD